jgi:hypothetical protein
MIRYFLPLVFLGSALFSAAQVIPVSKEPMHHNVFENDLLRVLDVHVPPGDTSLFHKHEIPSVFVVLTPVKTGSEVTMEDGTSTALVKDASISFESFSRSPRIHRVWNADSIEFHVMDIEILNREPKSSALPASGSGLRLLFDEQTVRGYRLSLNAHSKFAFPAGNPLLVICLNDGLKDVSANKTSFRKKGDFLFARAGEAMELINGGAAAYSFAVIEVK